MLTPKPSPSDGGMRASHTNMESLKPIKISPCHGCRHHSCLVSRSIVQNNKQQNSTRWLSWHPAFLGSYIIYSYLYIYFIYPHDVPIVKTHDVWWFMPVKALWFIDILPTHHPHGRAPRQGRLGDHGSPDWLAASTHQAWSGSCDWGASGASTGQAQWDAVWFCPIWGC